MLFLCGAVKKTDWRIQTVAPHFTFTLPQAHSHIRHAHTNKHAHTCILNSFDSSLSAVCCCTVLSPRLLISLFCFLFFFFWRSTAAASSPSSTFKNRTWMTKRYEIFLLFLASQRCEAATEATVCISRLQLPQLSEL